VEVAVVPEEEAEEEARTDCSLSGEVFLRGLVDEVWLDPCTVCSGEEEQEEEETSEEGDDEVAEEGEESLLVFLPALVLTELLSEEEVVEEEEEEEEVEVVVVDDEEEDEEEEEGEEEEEEEEEEFGVCVSVLTNDEYDAGGEFILLVLELFAAVAEPTATEKKDRKTERRNTEQNIIT
jgi:hypothetical protein